MNYSAYNNCTMEQLWGTGEKPLQDISFIAKPVRKRHRDPQLFCLQLDNGGYATVDESYNSIGSVKTMDLADLFTRDEASEICRRFWIRAKVIPFKQKIG